ncbi:MAG: carbohydrate ABC transporter permease, partial [Nocardioides sp.]
MAAGRRGDGILPWLFLAPYLVLFGAFVLLPIGLGLWISLHSWDFTLPGKPFVGLDNYRDLF